MKAFIEWLCEHALIVRTGPHAEKYRDPWEFAVACKKCEEDGEVIVKALVAPRVAVWWLRWLFPPLVFNRQHFKAIINALAMEDPPLHANWERIK